MSAIKKGVQRAQKGAWGQVVWGVGGPRLVIRVVDAIFRAMDDVRRQVCDMYRALHMDRALLKEFLSGFLVKSWHLVSLPGIWFDDMSRLT